MTGGKSFTEKLEHWSLLDILSIGIYVYFGYVSYTNLGYSKSDIMGVSTNPNVIAVQLAALLVVVNIIFLVHDRIGGSDDGLGH